MTNVSHARRSHGVGLLLGVLECLQYVAADLDSVLHGLQPGGERRPFVVPEVVILDACSDDQGVIAQAPALEPHLAGGDVHVPDVAQQHPCITLSLERGAQRSSDVTGPEPTRGDLVEQRLKQVEVPAVDDGHFDRRAPQVLRGVQSSEASTDDHHPMPLLL
jgi:hypothetical protein